jgi:hypothetical protein
VGLFFTLATLSIFSMSIFSVRFLRLNLLAQLFLLIALGSRSGLLCAMARSNKLIHDAELSEQENREIGQYVDPEIVVLVNQLASNSGTLESSNARAELLRKLLAKAKSDAEQHQRIREGTESAAEISRRIRGLTNMVEDLPSLGANGKN